MRNILTALLFLLLIGCAGGVEGHRWSAEFASQIQKGTPRSEVLKLIGKPYQTDTDDYDSSGGANEYHDYWRYDGQTFWTGRGTQEHLHIRYDKDMKVTNVQYIRAS